MEWLRLYTEIRNDRKLRRLPPAQRWLWVTMLTIARESPVPGALLLSENVPVNLEDLVDEAAITIEQVKAGIQSFKDQEMIEEINGVYYLINWNKRQFTSDSSTPRVRRHRDKKQQQDETLQERFNTVSETPPDSESDSEKHKTLALCSANKPNPGEQRKRAKTQEELFAIFWDAYPKKRSKGQAEKTWAKLRPDEQLVALMVAKIEQAKTSEEWTKQDGQFIPYPSTWLNAKGWEDEDIPQAADELDKKYADIYLT